MLCQNQPWAMGEMALSNSTEMNTLGIHDISAWTYVQRIQTQWIIDGVVIERYPTFYPS